MLRSAFSDKFKKKKYMYSHGGVCSDQMIFDSDSCGFPSDGKRTLGREIGNTSTVVE